MTRIEGIPTSPAARPSRPCNRWAGQSQWRSPLQSGAPLGPPKRDTEFKPYQLKPKKGTNVESPIAEPFVEQPPSDPKKLKRMKEKLDELNRKIRYSKKRHNGLIHKRNSLKKVIEGLKCGARPHASLESEPDWTFKEREQALNGAYRGYRVNGGPKMDVDTLFSRIREGLIELIK